MGFTGQGMVIGDQDTGQRWTHNALKQSIEAGMVSPPTTTLTGTTRFIPGGAHVVPTRWRLAMTLATAPIRREPP